MVQSHVVVEHLVAAEAVLEPLVVPTLQAVALDLDLRALLDARSLVGALEVDPPLLRLVQAVGVVVPGDRGHEMFHDDMFIYAIMNDQQSVIAMITRSCP